MSAAPGPRETEPDDGGNQVGRSGVVGGVEHPVPLATPVGLHGGGWRGGGRPGTVADRLGTAARRRDAGGDLSTTLAFDALFVAEHAAMVRLAHVALGSRAEAEEVVQDAFLRVHQRWERLAEPGGYLRTCVVNGARDVLRRRAVRERLGGRAGPVDRDGPDLGADHVLDAVDHLPPKRRLAVILRYYADLSEAEIAAAMDVRPGTVKSLLHRGIEQLRQEIER